MRCDKFLLRYGRLVSAVLHTHNKAQIRPRQNGDIFGTLPIEILDIILYYLPPKDRVSFSCVSKVPPSQQRFSLVHTKNSSPNQSH